MTSAVLVAAHYDDPILWAGGAIRRTRSLGWEWTVVGICVGEPARRAYFADWCRSLEVRAVACSFEDHPDGRPFTRNKPAGLECAVRRALRGAAFDWVFTHALDDAGEYGPHPNHAEAAQVVEALGRARVLRIDRVVRFRYGRLYRPMRVPSVAAVRASHYLPLDYDELRWKADWCRRAQAVERSDAALGGVTWLERLGWPCPNPEAFSVEGPGLPPPFVGRAGDER